MNEPLVVNFFRFFLHSLSIFHYFWNINTSIMSHQPSKHNFFDEGGVAAVGFMYVIFAILAITAMLYF
jgi:hypothetical protein